MWEISHCYVQRISNRRLIGISRVEVGTGAREKEGASKGRPKINGTRSFFTKFSTSLHNAFVELGFLLVYFAY